MNILLFVELQIFTEIYGVKQRFIQASNLSMSQKDIFGSSSTWKEAHMCTSCIITELDLMQFV